MRPFHSLLASALLVSSASAAVVRIDFGGTGAVTTEPGVTWNNLTGPTVGSGIADLRDINNVSTGLSISVTGAFRGVNAAGTGSSTLFPPNATSDSFFGNAVSTGSFSGTYLNSQLTLSGLNPLETYNFVFYASRVGDSANRTTAYTVTGGGGVQTVNLNATTVNGSVPANGVTADANGQIVIDVGPGAGNNTTERFFYIGVLEITSIPEPSVAVLGALSVLPLLRRRRA